MVESSERSDGFLSVREMKRKPVFKEIFVETGHPEHAVNSITEQLEDMGFEILSSGSSVSQDDVAEGVKTYLENIKAKRIEKEFRKNLDDYKKYFKIAIGVSIPLTLLIFASQFFIILALAGWISVAVFHNLLNPKIKKDRIWVKVKGKLYSGTKARELRETGKNKAGVTRTASTVYVHSEITFSVAGDSEIDVKRVRDDIDVLSKHIQKL